MKKEPLSLNALYLAFAALSAGWMVGMSVSPVVSVVISSVMAMMMTTVSILIGLKQNGETDKSVTQTFRRIPKINLWPITEIDLS